MTKPTPAKAKLDAAVKAYEMAFEAMLTASEDYMKDEALRLSRRLPGRMVSVYAGNGDRDIRISRRRPTASYSYNERNEFIFAGSPGLWRGTPDRLVQPEALTVLDALDDDLGFRTATLGVVGHFVAQDGRDVSPHGD